MTKKHKNIKTNNAQTAYTGKQINIKQTAQTAVDIL